MRNRSKRKFFQEPMTRADCQSGAAGRRIDQLRVDADGISGEDAGHSNCIGRSRERPAKIVLEIH
jgi:hypothetical protein